jgi:hypothetical protein
VTTLTTAQQTILDNVRLGHGNHPCGGDCLCFMETVAQLAGEPCTNDPKTACPTISGLAVPINDILPLEQLQTLKPLCADVLGTGDDGLAERRLAFTLRWMITEFVPEMLLKAGGFQIEADVMASYYDKLPIEYRPSNLLVWGAPLGSLQACRFAVRCKGMTMISDPSFERLMELRDLNHILNRIIGALTDYNDPGLWSDPDKFSRGITAQLNHMFLVNITYDFSRYSGMLTRFLPELVHTGRSYL